MASKMIDGRVSKSSLDGHLKRADLEFSLRTSRHSDLPVMTKIYYVLVSIQAPDGHWALML